MRMFWHYAPWEYLSRMVEYGALRAGNAGAEGELPMLWFSANQKWEATATKMAFGRDGSLVRLTFEQQNEHVGCIRFGIDANDPRLLNWKAACTTAGTPRGTRRALEKVGKKQGGNPEQWYATTSNIALDELVLQVWVNGWHPVTSPRDAAEAWRKLKA